MLKFRYLSNLDLLNEISVKIGITTYKFFRTSINTQFHSINTEIFKK